MALIRATSNSGGSGGGNVPFTLTAYSTRVIIESQNNYIYNDNGTTKIHYEYTIKGNSNTSGGFLFYGLIPAKTRTRQTQFPSNTDWSLSMPGVGGLGVNGSVTNGTRYTLNEDVVCDWNP